MASTINAAYATASYLHPARPLLHRTSIQMRRSIVWELQGPDLVASLTISHPDQVSKLRIVRSLQWWPDSRPDNRVFWWFDLSRKAERLQEDLLSAAVGWWQTGWRDEID